MHPEIRKTLLWAAEHTGYDWPTFVRLALSKEARRYATVAEQKAAIMVRYDISLSDANLLWAEIKQRKEEHNAKS